MNKEIKNIFIIIPYTREFDDVREVIRSSAIEVSKNRGEEINTIRLDELRGDFPIIKKMVESITQSDLLICDISINNPNVYYELGYAHGSSKSTILICQNNKRIPFNIGNNRVILYDRNQLHKELFTQLVKEINIHLDHPQFNRTTEKEKHERNKIFISYSHKDLEFLERLLIHLKPLEKEGLIDTWVDTKIKVGEKWRDKIKLALNNAQVAILLISADFLASDFIVENELPPLLAAAENMGTKIIPLILKPCRFKRDKNLADFQAINDPDNPLIHLDIANQETIYDNVSMMVENYLSKI